VHLELARHYTSREFIGESELRLGAGADRKTALIGIGVDTS
jgi:hypothetical protein